VYLTK